MYKLGLIGHPVSHSKSPLIHQQFFKQTQTKGTYDLFDVQENQLFSQLDKLKLSGIDGFNVTVPYKEKIIPYLDDLDDMAKRLMSVNTVKRKGNQFIGYNTDGIGYIESLKKAYPEFYRQLSDKNILILGAGGAARGIYFGLQSYNPNQIDLANRTVINAREITDCFSNSQTLSLSEAEEYLSIYDLIIQTTSVGMTPNVESQIISLKHLKRDTIVSDIVYNPKHTKLIKEAQKIGAPILYGEMMLWYQAAKSFEIWTGFTIENIEGIGI